MSGNICKQPEANEANTAEAVGMGKTPVCECSKAKGLQVPGPQLHDQIGWYVILHVNTRKKTWKKKQRGASLIVNSSQVSPNNKMGKDSRHLETQQLYTARSSLLKAKS